MRNELKNIGLDNEDIKEVISELRNNSYDFNSGNYRFITASDIDQIMCDELESDLYCLGCCTDWFIADCTSLDLEHIQNAQKSESFELLGALMAQNIGDVQSSMVSHDGYGHHFNHYDGNEDEIKLQGIDYYVFRTN